LSEIVACRPGDMAATFAGLGPWQEALDAYRAERRARAVEAEARS
jgi:hypothetical protein